MYLDNVLTNSEYMLKQTLELHQKGDIPVNSWVINLDQIAKNAKAISDEAKSVGVSTYLMSKQHNRNPYVNALALKMGIEKIVAVDFQGALSCREYNLPLGHAGHLNQIPKHLIKEVLKLNPDVITVYNIEHARWIETNCKLLNKTQDILIRVYDDNDSSFTGQEGGFYVKNIEKFIHQISFLKRVNLVGVTAFPCLKYNESLEEKITPTSNVNAINSAIKILKSNNITIKQINMPGNTSSREIMLLKNLGATHIEPGNALLGTSPSHAFDQDLPEKTAICYLSEVSHKYDKRYYAYGGGCYHTNYSNRMYAFIGNKWDNAKNQGKVFYKHNIKQDIDYHMQFIPEEDQKIDIGDSVIGVYRTQMHMTRSYHVAVSGMSGERPLKVHYILDNARGPLDKNLKPVSHKSVIKDIRSLLKQY